MNAKVQIEKGNSDARITLHNKCVSPFMIHILLRTVWSEWMHRNIVIYLFFIFNWTVLPWQCLRCYPVEGIGFLCQIPRHAVRRMHTFYRVACHGIENPCHIFDRARLSDPNHIDFIIFGLKQKGAFFCMFCLFVWNRLVGRNDRNYTSIQYNRWVSLGMSVYSWSSVKLHIRYFLCTDRWEGEFSLLKL